MGKYPSLFSDTQIVVAEQVLFTAVNRRLIHEGTSWKAPYSLLTASQLNEIRKRFAPGVEDATLLRFVEVAFAASLPLMHYEFTSNGYYLMLGGKKRGRTIIVKKLPISTSYYLQNPQSKGCRTLLETVSALLRHRLARFQESIVTDVYWPVVGDSGAPFVTGVLYETIKELGEFNYCRTQDVINLIQAAVPDIHANWEAAGLKLVACYQLRNDGITFAPFTTLELLPSPPTPA